VAEGAKVVREALASGCPVESVYVDPTRLDAAGQVVVDDAMAAGARVFELAPGVLDRLEGTVTPQPVLAVVPFVDVPLSSLASADLVIVCVELRDPGNLGTVLRSAEAAGAGGVVCCEGSVDVYNPKCVRASAGAVFHVPVVAGGEARSVLAQFGDWDVRRLGSRARDGQAVDAVDLTVPTAFVLGNEAHGLPDAVDEALDGHITIPMAGRAESLNVGMAAAVLVFEAARQRRAAG
jgi:TrmH family RNA methyltransferase